jgi:hypothetical protein
MVVHREVSRVGTAPVVPIVNRHRFEMTIRLKSANADGSTPALLNSKLIEELAKSLTVWTCKAQSWEYLTVLVGFFPDFVNQLRHVFDGR